MSGKESEEGKEGYGAAGAMVGRRFALGTSEVKEEWNSSYAPAVHLLSYLFNLSFCRGGFFCETIFCMLKSGVS